MEPAPTILAGRYRLGGLLGAGGMAEVRRAEDLSLGRSVAVKLLHPHLAADPSFMERFEREARLAASLSHPNVVAVFDRGVADGRPFLVMELVEGESLAELLGRAGRLPPERALAIGSDVLNALVHAHARGVVHRDLKPQNVMVDLDGCAKLADFGIAQAVAAAALTAPGEVFGSLRYMAPERLTGEPGSPATDLYGLGAVLYEALTGRPPFQGDHPASIAAQHAGRVPPPPSSLRPGLPPWVDAAVLRALAKEPGARFASAAAMRAALGGAGAPLPAPTVAVAPVAALTVPMRGPPLRRPDPPAPSPWRRTAGLVLAAGAVLALTAGALWLASNAAEQSGDTPTVASAAGTAARPSPGPATAVGSKPIAQPTATPIRPPPTPAAASPTPVPPSPTPRPQPTTRPPPSPMPTVDGDRLARLRDLIGQSAPAKPKPGRGNQDREDADEREAVRALLDRLDQAQRSVTAGRLDEARAQLRDLAARVATDAARGRIDAGLAARILGELRGLIGLI